MRITELRKRLEPGMQLMEMPSSTFRKTWEVQAVNQNGITVKIVDQAVGYEYATEDDEELTEEFTFEKLEELLKTDNDKGGWIIDD
jgi:hypothetical protein